ncbi:MAG TPA: tetratricopeptide repeat protein [Candidatus Goldiibacteriota bacterium]|nr:tetratricopeptide repeat protein [Candidatus Goldiibacteriota bacterium]HPN65135.1 tetratricopeptide repeat protein [Candidatus Goldiibacteriota bacterium]HRQ44592.1 tetratricopeptide repeat protein [Candidatus Goldiibacteriota bacterium]
MAVDNKANIKKMAMIYSQEGRWDKAIVEYKKLLALDPTDFTTHNMLGDVYKKKNEDELAYQEYMTAAEAHIKQGLADKAQVIYKKIGQLDSSKLNETDRKRQIMIKKHTEADKLIESGETDKAIEAYKEIVKISPESLDTYQKLGELYAQKGDKKESLVYYEKIVDIYFTKRMYKKALPIYQKIMEIQPDNIEVREKIAEIYEREGNDSDAKREFLFLAEYYWKEKNVERTEFYAQKAVEFKSIEAHYFKGAALFHKKVYDEAKKELEMLLKFKANHVGALQILANIHSDLGQTDEALSVYNKIVKAEEENTEAHEMIAELMLKKGQKKESAAKYIMVSNIYTKKQEYDKAVTALNKVLATEPENLEVLQKLADTYLLMKKKKEAADTFIKISDIYTKENLPDKANEAYKRAEENDPANKEIISRAKKLSGAPEPVQFSAPLPEPAPFSPKQEKEPGPVFMKQEMPVFELPPVAPAAEPAMPHIKPSDSIENVKIDYAPPAAHEQTKEDIPALLAMAESFINSGSFDEGIELFQKAIVLDPGNPEIKKKLNAAYSQYAGIPESAPDDGAAALKEEERKREQEEKKKKEEEEVKKKQKELTEELEAEKKKRAQEEENVKKRQQELMKKMEEDKKKKKEEEDRKKEETDKAKNETEERKKKEEEARKKTAEEERKRDSIESPRAESAPETDEGGIDFITVMSADIFLKQGLAAEAERILKKITVKEPDNMEAKQKLEEIMKRKDRHGRKEEGSESGKKQSKVSYI